MFNMTVATSESADTVLDLFDRFNIEGLSLEVIKGEFIITDSKTGKVYFTAEYAWEIDDYLSEIDHECYCDGADDAPYRCTFPPCVAEGEAEAAYYGTMFRAAQIATTDGIAAHKHPQRIEDVLNAVDEGRI